MLGEPVRPPEDLRAEPLDIERYLGNGYLETVARGLPHSAASGARRARNADEGAGGTRGPAFRSSVTLQAKLVVGAAGDAFEREADRVADELMRRAGAHALGDEPDPEQSYREDAPARVLRQTTRGVEKGTDLPPELAAQVARLRGGGMPLPARERALFESLLGVDLGSVRIHTGVAAMQTARALNARAYTVGPDIAFGSGQYRPGTDSGRRLLAHELVHTVQQRDTYPGAAEASSVQCKGGAGEAMSAGRPRPVRDMGPLDHHPRYPVALGLLRSIQWSRRQVWSSSSTSPESRDTENRSPP